MEKLLGTASQEECIVLSIDIADVADMHNGPATLYVLNGGMQPPKPRLGDFLYDFANHAFSVYYTRGWKNVTMHDVISLVRHPNENNFIVSFTFKALPYWVPARKNQVSVPKRFDTVHDILAHFKVSVDTRIIKAERFPRTSSKPHRFSILHPCTFIMVIQRDLLKKWEEEGLKVREKGVLGQVSFSGCIFPAWGLIRDRACTACQSHCRNIAGGEQREESGN